MHQLQKSSNLIVLIVLMDRSLLWREESQTVCVVDVQLSLEVLGGDGPQEAEGLHSVNWGITQGEGAAFFL